MLRKKGVWIGGSGSSPKDATYVPPSPDQVEGLTESLLGDWRDKYAGLVVAEDKSSVLRAITEFHHSLLSIHPFMDGNGRLARFLLMQQAFELLNYDGYVVIEDSKPYVDALNVAHQGDLTPLETIITQAIFGTEILVY